MGTGWTIAGIVGYLCGVPLQLPFDLEKVTQHYFLNSAQCVPDVLNHYGYEQRHILGVAEQFGGTATFFQLHKSAVKGLTFYQENKILPKKLDDSLGGTEKFIVLKNQKIQGTGKWGVNDRTMFSLAVKEIQNLKERGKPFALYISTMDTHPPNGFIDPVLCGDIPSSVLNSFTCSERTVLNFLSQILKIDPTMAVILLGDHLPQGIKELQNQGIYNLFIQPSFEKDLDKSQLKNRALSHFDVAPLILESVGIPQNALGLGRNPLKNKTLLEELGEASFNQDLVRRNRFYEDLWKNPR